MAVVSVARGEEVVTVSTNAFEIEGRDLAGLYTKSGWVSGEGFRRGRREAAFGVVLAGAPDGSRVWVEDGVSGWEFTDLNKARKAFVARVKKALAEELAWLELVKAIKAA